MVLHALILSLEETLWLESMVRRDPASSAAVSAVSRCMDLRQTEIDLSHLETAETAALLAGSLRTIDSSQAAHGPAGQSPYSSITGRLPLLRVSSSDRISA
jgi:hypothetical protein